MDRFSKSRLINYQFSGELVYEIAFVYYFTIVFLQSSTYRDYFPPQIFHYLSLFGLVLVLFKIFFLDTQKIGTFSFNLLCISFLVLTWRTSQDFTLLPMGVFILGARNVDFRRIIQLYFGVGLILLLFIMFSTSIGLIRNLVYYRTDSSTVRQSFGIVYPTDFAAHVLFLVLSYVYLRFKKLSWGSYITFMIIAYLLILFCDARLNALAVMLIIPVVLISKGAIQRKKISSFFVSFYWIIPIMAAYVSWIVSIFYSQQNSFLNRINADLSGRLKISHLAFEKYGFSLFGKKILEHGMAGTKELLNFNGDLSQYFYIDSSYIRIMSFYGIIAFVLIITVMTIIMRRSIRYGLFDLASIMVIVSISALVEQRLIDLTYDPFLLALFSSQFTSYLHLKGEKIEKL